MKNYYYFKNTKKEIEFLEESEFYLRFGGAFEHILSNFCVNMYLEKNIEIPAEKKEKLFFMDFINNWNNYKEQWSDLEAISFYDLSKEQQTALLQEIETKNNDIQKCQIDLTSVSSRLTSVSNGIDTGVKPIPYINTYNNIYCPSERTQKNKSVGNGEGSLCTNKITGLLEFYYHNPNGKRKAIRQKKNETIKEFKAKVTELKEQLNKGTYIEKSYETVVSIASRHIEQKFKSKKTKARAYKRNLETLEQIKKTCKNFCYKPIQKVTIDDIENAKPFISKYANNTIDKIWGLLRKVFVIACSPSRKILTFNIMLDETLEKPISEKITKKVKSLTFAEAKKLNDILDNEEKNHKYRNIIKMQLVSAMRIGEVLARSINDLDRENKTFNVHNTLTEDENYNVILGEHTKTYDKKTQIDKGQRYLPLDTSIFSDLMCIIEVISSSKLKNMHNLLFWDYEDNTFITPKQVNAYLRRLNQKYNICEENLTTHRLRHTAITYWRHVLKLPLEVVQYLAGHVEDSDITDEVYIETNLETVKLHLQNVC